MEPAGALAVAGLKTWVGRERGRRAAARRGAQRRQHELRSPALRRRARGARRGARSAARASPFPSGRARSASSAPRLGRRVVTEFNYRLSGRDQAHIFVGVATESREDAAALAAARCAAGYETVDLTDNEMAKLHVRHMVGGRAPDVRHERLVPVRVPRASGRADAVPRRRSAAAGTSACSTTATTAPTSAACWRGSRCRTSSCRSSARSSIAWATRTSRSSRTTLTNCFSNEIVGPVLGRTVRAGPSALRSLELAAHSKSRPTTRL